MVNSTATTRNIIPEYNNISSTAVSEVTIVDEYMSTNNNPTPIYVPKGDLELPGTLCR
ncbi:hypothetical protein YN1HA_5000 [Sulfurisphaera ohwakuensis]